MSRLTFHYTAIDQQGAKTRGSLQADDPSEAYRQISAAGLKPLKLKSRGGGLLSRRSKRLGVRDLAHLTYQFSVLMEARIPVAEGLRSIAEQESNDRLREIIHDVAGQIEAGYSVTDAMSQHRDLFGEVYIETIRAAEASGNMVKILSRLAEMLERRYETNKSIKGALIYPMCVVVAMSLSLVFLLVFIVPKFSGLYARQNMELPLPTQILVSSSEFVRTYWHLLTAGLVAGVLGLRRAWRKREVRYKVDGLLHRVPFLRDILRGLAVSRFSHVLGTTLQSGIGLLEALEMAGAASGRPLLEEDAQKMRQHVKEGGRLADVMLACAYLPGFARRMIAAGEEAAEMPRMCEIVGRHFDREVAHLTKNLPTVLEPILIFGLALIFLVIALAIFLPMWDVGVLMSG